MTPLAASRDANNATWYVLRYPADFRPRTDPSLRPWMSPVLEPTLFYDGDRHVVELLPGRPAAAAEPLPGLAVDVDGQVYSVDPRTGRVMVRCGNAVRELVRERGAIAAAAGLALDRRGLLYIADPRAHRVLAVTPDDGSLAGALAGGLEEPVDVAASAGGRIYVADRQAGRIVVFNSRFDRIAMFTPVDAEGVIDVPRPIAVMVDRDGAVLVADANYPRLLRFSPDGTLLGDAEPHALARQLDEPGVALDALEKAYGKVLPPGARGAGAEETLATGRGASRGYQGAESLGRFYAGVCACPPARDGGARLTEIHRAIRLLRLALAHAFAPCGTFVSAALDGGTPGIQWHKIAIDADLPDGTWMKVQTVTADDPEQLNDPASIPTAGENADPLGLTGPAFLPFEDASCSVKARVAGDVPDRLVFSPPGRYLRLRITLGSDGRATPSVRAVRLFYPRASYLDLLPRVYRRDAGSALFLEHFLALFEHVFTGIEDRYERFTRELNPGAAPLAVLNWLACLIDLSFDPSWPLERRRALVAAAMELYATRGTPRGLARFIEIYTGTRPVILEAFLERPQQPAFLGLPGAFLGGTTRLTWPLRGAEPGSSFAARAAHRFAVVVFVDEVCDEEVLLAVVDRIVEVNKPAHTEHALRVVRADARVGSARIGIDAMLGARGAAGTRLGGCTAANLPADQGSVLGGDSILGEARPAYARPFALSI